MPFSKSFVPTPSSVSSTDQNLVTQQPQKPSLKQTLMQWLKLNSFAGKLFWMIMLGALSGVGGMAFLFSEMIKYQAEDQVRSTLDGKVNEIASVTEAAETLAYGLGVSATTLHERQAQFPDTYRELTLQLFERRPEFVVGLGVGQSQNGLVIDQPWLFPYYWVNTSEDSAAIANQTVRYENFADDEGEFYPESERYQQYFVPQQTIWTEPYQQGANQLLTYYFPLVGNDGKWLGTTLVDIDSQYLGELINDPVFRKQGNFLLLTRSGNIVVDPSNPENNLDTYEGIADLRDLWSEIDLNASTGFLEGENGYWAYASVPDQEWLVFGFVPYTAVFNRIALITLLATTLMVVLLSIAITLAIRSLNRRLRPVLNQCNQLAETERVLLEQWDHQDDLSQLSLAFFNMLERLNLNAETIRRHEKKIEKESLHSEQVSEQFEDLNHLLIRQASEQQSLAQNARQQIVEVARSFQVLNRQLEVTNTMARDLGGEFRRLPAHSTEVLSVLEKQVEALKKALEAGQSTTQLQLLADQVEKNVFTLRAHDQRWPSIDSLQHQTNQIAQTGQSALDKAQTIDNSVESIAKMLAEIEQIATTLVRRSQSFSE
ncbi:MAG: Cache domain-containing protein [Leptolyngbya sp. SIO3F4]|nr:Cache domain-containing protein [Leptolyngbya sp. SIO3F4]